MNKRWLILSLALAGLAFVGWWIARNTYWDEVPIPTPLRGDAVTNPFYTAQRLAESLGATTEWRQALGTPPANNSVIVLSYWHWSLIEKRRMQLEKWVQDGGRLVLDHTLIGGERELKQWSGLELTYKEEEDDDEEQEESASDAEPESTSEPESLEPDYYTESVCGTLLASYSPKASDPTDRYSICQLVPDSWIVSERPVFWALHDNDGMQAARIEIGSGSVTLLNANPFGNRDLTEIDHGLLFVAVTQLRPGDHVVFLSEEEHPSLLALIWQNGKPAVLLAALFILATLWRSAVRFGPPAAPTETARRSLAEQIRGTGLFTLQFGGSQTLHAAMMRAVEDAARRRIVNYSHLPSGARVAALAQASGLDTAKLGEAIHHRGTRSKHDLQHAIALLETVRRALLDNASRH
jgi:hypothetical protein